LKKKRLKNCGSQEGIKAWPEFHFWFGFFGFWEVVSKFNTVFFHRRGGEAQRKPDKTRLNSN